MNKKGIEQGRSFGPRFNRRNFGLGTAAYLARMVTDRGTAAAWGTDCYFGQGAIPLEATSKEVTAFQPLLPEYTRRTQSLAERLLSPTLVRLGVSLDPNKVAYLKLLPTPSGPATNDYVLSNDMKVSSDRAIDVLTASRYTRRKRYINTSFMIPLTSVDLLTSTYPTTIEGLNNFLTRVSRGETFLLAKDFEPALRDTYNLPEDIEWAPDVIMSGLQTREGEFYTPYGELVTVVANTEGILILTVEPEHP